MSLTMSQTWKVSWNHNKYDYKGVIDAFNKKEVDVIYQSKGRASMKILPLVGDYVYVSCNKLKIMKCIVLSEFMTGTEEKYDVFNKETVREHATNDTYLKMKILEVYNDPHTLHGNQRTWCKYDGN